MSSPPPRAEETPPPPPPKEETPPPAEEAPLPDPEPEPVEEVFNPESISQEMFDAAKTEVQAFIQELNDIIRARNFRAWTEHLSESYFALISSKEFLDGKTEELYKRDQIVAANLGRDPRMVEKKLLRTPLDYFNNVVVPSRSNDRVDDIDFVSENRVKAYTMDGRGNRLVLYDLEEIDNKWKIIS